MNETEEEKKLFAECIRKKRLDTELSVAKLQ